MRISGIGAVFQVALSFAMAAALFAAPVSAQDRTQGRSMVVSQRGIVAAENPLAAQAGATVLAQGGNAIDAAVATNAVTARVSLRFTFQESWRNNPHCDFPRR